MSSTDNDLTINIPALPVLRAPVNTLPNQHLAVFK